MTAFVDAMVFLAVIMMAIAVTIAHSPVQGGGGADPDQFLDALGSIEVRMSDMTDKDDDTLVYLVDLMAMSLFETNASQDYVEDILDTLFGQRVYSLSMEYGSRSASFGTSSDYWSVEDTRSYAISTGGTLNVTLRTL